MAAFDQRQWFDDYIDALNRDDLERVATFYAPDLHMTDGAVEHHAATALMGFHRQWQGRVRRTLDLLGYVDRPGRIAAEISTALEALSDVPDFPDAPLAAGERRAMVSFVICDIADGRFTRIRAAPCKATP
ncbi:nuclear transport factor 2 family protein [Niveispirillum sp. SYP-B3756]|uniref:nuclear transport factor 2 family protein n=1 Tax=Niveispirillum sp. SYP-B3756 TaxID=2662178 RepID=UPI001566FA17|nr:nuclear transport factor 2 family protein [Niveispirillum sp. SYP-B3756]